jgi:hypothetical protein
MAAAHVVTSIVTCMVPVTCMALELVSLTPCCKEGDTIPGELAYSRVIIKKI